MDIPSLLPQLEPIAGAALALNVAYLNLERFRYRKEIRAFATDGLGIVAPDGPDKLPKEWKTNHLYKQVELLAGLPNVDDEKKWEKEFFKNKDNVPDANWFKIYMNLYHYQFDRALSFIMGILSFILLAGGVAHSIGHLVFASCLFSNGFELVSFYLLVASTVFPVMFIILGGWCVRRSKRLVRRNINSLSELLQSAIGQAEVQNNDP